MVLDISMRAKEVLHQISISQEGIQDVTEATLKIQIIYCMVLKSELKRARTNNIFVWLVFCIFFEEARGSFLTHERSLDGY
jgi:hypothetical protein